MKLIALRNFKRKNDDPHYRLFVKGEVGQKEEVGVMWNKRSKNGNKYFNIYLYGEVQPCSTKS